MVLPIGEAGISQLSNEEPVLAAMKENISEPGLYFFPGMPEGMNEEAWMEKMEAGPSGIMVVHPNGVEPIMASNLLIELLSDIIAVLIVAFLLTKALGNTASFGSKVFFVTIAGVLPFFVVDVSYWNWYKFPSSYTFAQLADQVIGFFFAGLVVAWRFKSAPSLPPL